MCIRPLWIGRAWCVLSEGPAQVTVLLDTAEEGTAGQSVTDQSRSACNHSDRLAREGPPPPLRPARTRRRRPQVKGAVTKSNRSPTPPSPKPPQHIPPSH